jgi:hypothetical protein
MKCLFFILIICGFYSCGDDPTQTHTLINETELPLKIHGFSHRGTETNQFIKNAEIINLEALEHISFERSSGESFDSRTFFSIPDIDSVRIVFNDKKLLVLERNFSDKRSSHSIFQAFEALITQEDYDSAQLIE